MKLPRKIKVGKRWYSVEVVEAMRDKFLGMVYHGTGAIQIRKRSHAGMTDTFWHEVVHAILYEMDSPLHRNEAFVSEFADKLSKAIKTAEFG